MIHIDLHSPTTVRTRSDGLVNDVVGDVQVLCAEDSDGGGEAVMEGAVVDVRWFLGGHGANVEEGERVARVVGVGPAFLPRVVKLYVAEARQT